MSWSWTAGTPNILTSTGGTSGSPDLISTGVALAQTNNAAAGYRNGYEGWLDAVEVRVAAGSWVKLDDDFQLELRTSSFINPQGAGFEMGPRSTLIINTTTSRQDTAVDFQTGSSFVCQRTNPNDPSPRIVYRNTVRHDFPTILQTAGSVPALIDIDGLDLYGAGGTNTFIKLYFGLATTKTVKNVRFLAASGVNSQFYGTTYDDFYSESMSLESEATANSSVFNRPTYYRSASAAWRGSIRLANYIMRNPTFLNNCWNGSIAVDSLGGAPTSATKIQHVYTFAHTIKTGLTALQNVKVRYYRAVESSQNSPAWAAPPNAVIDATTNASGTFTAVDLLDAYYEGPSLNAIQRFNWTCKARRYDYRSPAETVFASRVLYQGSVNMAAGYNEQVQMLPVSHLTLTEAQAAALTGIAMAPTAPTGGAIDTTTGTVTVTVARTVAELWQFYRQWIAQTGNYASQDTWTYDGVTLNVGAWNVVVNGVTLTGNVTTSGTVSGTGSYAGVITSSAGTTTPVTITGLDGHAVAVYDNTGTRVAYTASATGSYTYYVAAGATGTWTYRVTKHGYTADTTTFDPAGVALSFAQGTQIDPAVTQTNAATVAAYTTLDNPDKIYDYSSYWATTSAGIDTPKFTSKAGTAMALGSVPLTVNSGASGPWGYSGGVLTVKTASLGAGTTFTAITTSGALTLTGAVLAYPLLVTSSAGRIGWLAVPGLSGHAVAVYDNSNTQRTYSASVTGTFTYQIPAGSTGTWTWIAKRLDLSTGSDTFGPTGGGLFTGGATFITDTGVTETNAATVAAYTQLTDLGRLYDYIAYYKTTSAGILVPNASGKLATRSGNAVDLGNRNLVIDATAGSALAWNSGTNTITIKAGTLTIGGPFTSIETTGTVTTANGATIDPAVIVTSSAGTTGGLVITGLTSGTSIAVYDGSNVQQAYVASSGTSYGYTVAAAATGTWRYVIKRPGYLYQAGSFPADGLTTVAATAVQILNPDGTAMYAGTTSPLVTVGFTGTTQATIDIGDGSPPLQAVYDETEQALVTAAGLAWLNAGNANVRMFQGPSGNFLFLSTGWRLRRATAGAVNATVAAYVQSADDIPVDTTNGTVTVLAVDSADSVAELVWDADTRTLSEYTLPGGERVVVMDPTGVMVARLQ